MYIHFSVSFDTISRKTLSFSMGAPLVHMCSFAGQGRHKSIQISILSTYKKIVSFTGARSIFIDPIFNNIFFSSLSMKNISINTMKTTFFSYCSRFPRLYALACGENHSVILSISSNLLMKSIIFHSFLTILIQFC